MPTANQLAKLTGSIVLAAGLVAGLLFPLAGGFGLVSNKASDTVDNVSSEILEGKVPAISTMVDSTGKPIAYLYEQRGRKFQRQNLQRDETRDRLDRGQAFAEHHGVDWTGTLRALVTNTSSGEVQQGASTSTSSTSRTTNCSSSPRPTPSGAPPSKPPRPASCGKSGWR